MQSPSSPASAASQLNPTPSRKRKRGSSQVHGLTVLHTPPAEAIIADLIFVHGLQGHPRKTWQTKLEAPARKWSIFGLPRRQPNVEEEEAEEAENNGTYWPADVLPEDCKNIRILTYGYDSHVSHFFKGPANKLNLSQLGEGLLNRVTGERRRSNAIGRPVVFIAHSLGGLLVKEALIESKKQGSNPDKADVYKSTHGIVFFGTPHRGSSDAQWGLILKSIAGTIFDTNDKLLRTLQPDNELLAKVAKDFQDILDEGQLRICSLLESSGKTGLPVFNGKVVPDFSASFGSRKFEHQDYIQQNHMNMCRFSGLEDNGYKCFLDGLEFCMKDIPSKEETREGLLQSLKFENMSMREAQLIDTNFITVDWIWRLSSGPTSFSQWLSSKTGVFWIQGKPASGKSTLMKYLKNHSKTRHYLAQNSSRGWTLVHFFFDFRARNGISNSFDGLIRAILHQLVCELPELSISIARIGIADPLQPQTQQEFRWTSTKLRSALLKALQTNTNNILLLIDGIDEIEGASRDMIDMIELFQEIDRLDNSDHRVKVCIASRPDPLMVTAFSQSCGFKLQDYNYDGIRNYIDRRMRISAPGSGDPEPSQLNLLKFTELVAKRSQGVFLWARFATEELLEGNANGDDSNDLWARLEALPDELEAIYQRIMTQMIHKYGTSEETSVMLQIAYFTLLPLSIQEFYIVFQHSMRGQVLYEPCSLESFEKRLRAKTGGLVEVVGGKLGKVKLIHETVRSYCDRLCGSVGRLPIMEVDKSVSRQLPTWFDNPLTEEASLSCWNSFSCPPPDFQTRFPDIFNPTEQEMKANSNSSRENRPQTQNFTNIDDDMANFDASSPSDQSARASPNHYNSQKQGAPLQGIYQKQRQLTTLDGKAKACIRCRMLRVRCNLDATNPQGPCMTCVSVIGNKPLPCLRYKLSECLLVQTKCTVLDWPQVSLQTSRNALSPGGERYWRGNNTITVELRRDYGLHLKLPIRGFTFIETTRELSFVDTNALGIENSTEAITRIIYCIEESIPAYINRESERGDQATHICFEAVLEMNKQSKPCELLRHALLVWAVQRALHESWKVAIPPDPHLEFDTVHEIPITPILRYQIEAILQIQVLKPLERKVLTNLNAMILNKGDNWLLVFLVIFILLDLCESQIAWDNCTTQVHSNATPLNNKNFSRNIEQTAMALLAYFHYYCKRYSSFSKNSPGPNSREFSGDFGNLARDLVQSLRNIIPEEDRSINRYSNPKEYNGTSWFKGQMFVSDWSPRPSLFD